MNRIAGRDKNCAQDSSAHLAHGRVRYGGAVLVFHLQRVWDWGCLVLDCRISRFFLGGLLRGIYQIALSYGVDVREKHEQVYLMLLLACAGAPQQERQERLDLLAQEIQAGREISECLELVQREAAESLAQGMLTAKFIQGLPIVGVAGGIYNLPLYRRITGYAMLQYQKRYLWGLSARK